MRRIFDFLFDGMVFRRCVKNKKHHIGELLTRLGRERLPTPPVKGFDSSLAC
jgi:hypothetical protein